MTSQVAVIPLDWDVKPHKNIAPLEMWFNAKRPEHIDLEALKITKSELGATPNWRYRIL